MYSRHYRAKIFCSSILVAATAGIAGLLIAPLAGAGPTSQDLGQRGFAVSTGTPIVDPVPTETPPPLPLYLSIVHRDYDPRLPGPVPSRLEGYVAKLQPDGRRDCAPASHALLDSPEGSAGARVISLLHRARPEPELNLDLYLGDYVEVTGPVSMAPERCRHLTWQIMAVSQITGRELPPGAESAKLRPTDTGPDRHPGSLGFGAALDREPKR